MLLLPFWIKEFDFELQQILLYKMASNVGITMRFVIVLYNSRGISVHAFEFS